MKIIKIIKTIILALFFAGVLLVMARLLNENKVLKQQLETKNCVSVAEIEGCELASRDMEHAVEELSYDLTVCKTRLDLIVEKSMEYVKQNCR